MAAMFYNELCNKNMLLEKMLKSVILFFVKDRTCSSYEYTCTSHLRHTTTKIITVITDGVTLL